MFTRAGFEHACKSLVDKNRSSDFADWSWTEHPRYSGLGYLQRHSACLLPHSSSANNDDPLQYPIEQVVEQEDEAAATVQPTDVEILSIWQSVVYSATYQLPTLYFSMHDSNGRPLTLEDILRSNFFRPGVLPQSERTSFALQLPTSQFPLLSQGEHPSTGTPCWYFHPCETETALRELLEADRETRVIEDEIVRLMELWFLLLGNVVDMHRDRQSRVAGTTGSGGG